MAHPMYRRIADELRGEIESGRLGPGHQLPTEDQLSKQFDASRNTIRDAIKSLITLGLVETGQDTACSWRIGSTRSSLLCPPIRRPASVAAKKRPTSPR